MSWLGPTELHNFISEHHPKEAGSFDASRGSSFHGLGVELAIITPIQHICTSFTKNHGQGGKRIKLI